MHSCAAGPEQLSPLSLGVGSTQGCAGPAGSVGQQLEVGGGCRRWVNLQ